MDWQAIWLSVKLASATTVILLLLGLPLAYWLTFSPRRWKFLVEALSGFAADSAANRAVILHPARHRPAMPGGSAVRDSDRRPAAILVSRIADRVRALQSAIHHSACGRGLRRRRSHSGYVPDSGRRPRLDARI